MSRKKKHPGSDYAWKHGLVTKKETPANKLKSLLTPEEFDSLYKPAEFEKMFGRMSLSDQISFFTRLYSLMDTNGRIQLSQDDEAVSYLAENRMAQLLRNMRAKIVSGHCPVISADEAKIIRAECSGSINRLSSNSKVSMLYKIFNKEENLGSYPLRAYNLRKSPMWRVFRQFESYRNIERDLKRYLQRKGINPEALKVMSVTDFFDALYHTFKKGDSEIAYFMPDGSSIKQQILKDIMQVCREQIEDKLIQEGYDIRCVKSICNAAARFGVWSPNTVVPAEIYYTQKVIDDLKENGFDVSGVRVGDVISQDFVDYMVEHHQLELLRARTPNGVEISARTLPNLHFHHNLSHVILARSLPSIAAANYPNSGVFVLDKIHNRVLHNTHDKLTHIFNREQFYLHIQITDPSLKILFGMDAKTDGIFCDLEKSPRFLKRRKQDMKNVVDYNEMEMLRQYHVNQLQSFCQLRNIKGRPAKKRERQKREDIAEIISYNYIRNQGK